MAASPPVSIEWSHAREAQLPAARCVSLPFTAPALTSMRVRRAPQGGLEMLLINPAGGRGVYIARWSALRAFAAPSLHDILLAERIAAAIAAGAALSPAIIRDAAFAVATAGHAGRRLAKIADETHAARQLGLRRMRAHLLLELARHHDLPGSHSALNDPWSTQPQEESGWLAAAPALLAPKLHLPAGELADAMLAIARLALPIGAGPRAEAAYFPRVLRLLCKARVCKEQGGSGAIDDAMHNRHVEANAALRQARAVLARPAALVAAWREDAAKVRPLLEQPDWLLDGWDRLCLLDPEATEAAALLQMLLYDGDNDKTVRRVELDAAAPMALNAAAACFELQSRNEAIRMRELQLHDPDQADLDD
ncbi:hypothetical protein [Lichenicoccus sp.]|uniref:hypothetical protein n=1 Tax=Lichenicoccus sp. TaxID=2781899 RepID=UPI003D14BCCE